MHTNYFSLRVSTLTRGLGVNPTLLSATEELGRNSFEGQRRDGVDVNNALEAAESVMLENLQTVLDGASRLKELLAIDFSQHPELAEPPHLTHLFQQLQPILSHVNSEQWTRLAELMVVGMVAEYVEENQMAHGV